MVRNTYHTGGKIRIIQPLGLIRIIHAYKILENSKKNNTNFMSVLKNLKLVSVRPNNYQCIIPANHCFIASLVSTRWTKTLLLCQMYLHTPVSTLRQKNIMLYFMFI